MSAMAASCQGVNDLLACGSVAAWRCGMAQYRLGALDTAAAMPPMLAAQALGLPASTGADLLGGVLQTLRGNPWITPQDALGSEGRLKELKLVAKAGAFRGFAGPFLSPPLVATVAGELIANDGSEQWRLQADIYNSVLLRCEVSVAGESHPEVKILSNGTVSWQGHLRRFPELAHATSIAAVGQTVAVTLADSHHLFLLGML
jgi:hypothetical protein